MPRRRVAAKRKLIPDPVFQSERVVRFINCVMKDGKKSVAEKIVYGALDNALAKKQKDKPSDNGQASFADEKRREDALHLFNDVLHAVRPTVEVRPRRVGGSTYQIPMEVETARGIALAMRWIRDAARSRGEKTMTLRLANEFVDALDGRGGSVKKREEIHRMAKANQAFAHYRW